MHIRILVNKQFLIFIIGGAASAIIDIGTMQLMILFAFNPLIAATIGFLTGLSFNYAFHSVFTFRLSKSLSPPPIEILLRFIAVVVINYLITILFVYISFSVLNIGVLIGKVLSLPIVAINGYLLSKYWVFQ